MTSKIVVNNIESDAGVSTVTIIGDVSVGSSITATDITATHHGSGANLTSLAAANLTGTIADARISSSSVTQHVTSFSDDNITNDISVLALKVSALENSAASNTNSTFVDTYQSDAGVSTTTNVVRDSSGEYFSTFQAGSFGTLQNFVAANWNYGNLQAWSAGTATFSHGTSPDEDGMGQTLGASSEISFPASTPFQWSLVGANGSGYGPYINIQLVSNSDTGTVSNTTNFRNDGRATANSIRIRLDAANNGLYVEEYNNSGTENSLVSAGADMDGATTLITRDTAGIFRIYKNGSLQTTSTIAITGAMQFAIGGTGSHSASASSMQYSVGTPESNNATGSYQSTTITAASTTSKMGVVITYVDNAGTATLNTDLKVSLSADNGSNYTLVTLVAQPNFSTGVKMAKANDVTISNTGTQLKYKVEFANQASGSKVTRVTGVSLQY